MVPAYRPLLVALHHVQHATKRNASIKTLYSPRLKPAIAQHKKLSAPVCTAANRQYLSALSALAALASRTEASRTHWRIMAKSIHVVSKLNNAKHAVNHIEQGAPDLVASSVPGQTWLVSLTYNNLTYARSESLCTGGIPIPSPKRAQHPSTVGKNGASCQLGGMAASLRVQTMPYCQGRCYGACGLLQSTPSTYNSKQLSHRVIGRSVAHNEVSS